MKAIRNMWLIHIEITNACVHECPNCTRFVGHHKKTYFMDLNQIEESLKSLKGYKGNVGIMGGEPTLHKDFEQICSLVNKYFPPHKCGLWTSGHKWDKYKKTIKDTFKLGVYYNDHSDKSQAHQPILIGINEVIDDKKLMWRLIDKCWIQEQWSASINPKGGFFCEVAAAQDMLFDGPGGYPLENGWWKRDVQEFQDQVKRYCVNCSGCIPFDRIKIDHDYDLISPLNLKKLKQVGSPKALKHKYKIFDKKMSSDILRNKKLGWKPWKYLGVLGKRKNSIKIDELFIMKGFHRLRRTYHKILYYLKK